MLRLAPGSVNRRGVRRIRPDLRKGLLVGEPEQREAVLPRAQDGDRL